MRRRSCETEGRAFRLEQGNKDTEVNEITRTEAATQFCIMELSLKCKLFVIKNKILLHLGIQTLNN